jgi:hypothetical protein
VRALSDVRTWSILALAGLGAALAVDAANLWTARRLASAQEARLSGLADRPLPGFDPAGNPVTTEGAPCVLLRYSSGHCGFCRKDAAIFGRMDQRLKELGCRAVLVPPTSRDRPPEAELAGIARDVIPFVSVGFAVDSAFTRTPTTVLLKARRTWSRTGVLSQQDIETALAFAGR